jgi:lysyl-tRNA synthetase class 2
MSDETTTLGPAEQALADERVVGDRVAKLARLRERGAEPYAYSYDPTHAAAEALDAFAAHESAHPDAEMGGTVRVAGRIVSKRVMGKSTFAHLADRTGKIQLYFRVNDLADRYELLDLIEHSDWLGAEGTLFRTRTGEVSLRVSSFTLLSKALRPLPFGKEDIDAETGERRVYSGFTDVEARYRQRYADLAVNPEVRDTFVLRAKVVRALRQFLDDRGFVEVETPVLQPLYGGALARPFTTHHNTLDMQLYLRIAVELYLKRLIVGGMERVYEIGKNFRNEGLSRFHNPEFTMLEFYAAYMDYEDVMRLTEELLIHVVDQVLGGGPVRFGEHEIRFEAPFARYTMYEAIREFGGVDVPSLSDDELRAAVLAIPDLKDRAKVIAEIHTMGRGKLVDELFGAYAEPKMIQPTFITDYPREMSPLAKSKRGEPELTERFELMVAGKELLNAYSELNDPIDQRERFESQTRLAAAGDEETQPLDEDFLRAMEYGMPPTGGFGMGIDRLMMILSGHPSIRDVILFPSMRPE